MKKTIIILFLGLLIASCSGKKEQLAGATGYMEVSSGDTALRMHERLLFYDGKLFTGKVTEQNNGRVVSVKTYRNGNPDGLHVTYYPCGSICEERYFENGLKSGEQKGWWENGKLKFVYHYKNDEFNGSVKVWNESGMLFNDFNYVNGKENGLQKAWTSNGEIQANYVVKGNRKYGITGVKDCRTELPQYTGK